MRSFKAAFFAAIAAFSLQAAAAAPASATPVTDTAVPLTNVTNNSTIAATVASQFVVTMTNQIMSGVNYLGFTIANSGKIASSLVSIYFDDGKTPLFSGIYAFSGTPGVSFSLGGKPGDLPGGNVVGFSADALLTANSPGAKNGVNPGEAINVLLSYAAGKGFADALGQYNAGDFTLGLHVTGIPLGTSTISDSFVSAPAPKAMVKMAAAAVPEPGVLALMGAGLAGIGLMRRRRAA